MHPSTSCGCPTQATTTTRSMLHGGPSLPTTLLSG
ncbi:hypothetical protein E2C01_098394 [Portunus trituberculatus]|uniref:Uncharacterized protein n=1 Tax=Portunus trituberculatus TaxID=210409 RepID=A0A5B7K6W4_PORTR|nr:hypothetical protein [Portunus trituberculatus]